MEVHRLPVILIIYIVLYCIVTSECPDKSFLGTYEIDRVIDYEIKNGKIYGFWQTHFDEKKEYINNDNDKEIGKKIIYYFTRYSDKKVDIEEIAREINIPVDEVEKKIEKLYFADLVYKPSGRNFAFNDICLMRYINYVYSQDLKDVKKIDLSEKGKFNYYKGKFLELVVYQIMSRFNNETLEGKFFGRQEPVLANNLSFVTEKYSKGEKTSLYQIDLFGKNADQKGVWLCECKYKKTKMGINEIKKLENAKKSFIEEESYHYPKDIDYNKDIKLWYVSISGFTKEAINYMNKKEDVYYSDHDSINAIYKKFGGGFDIPIFEK